MRKLVIHTSKIAKKNLDKRAMEEYTAEKERREELLDLILSRIKKSYVGDPLFICIDLCLCEPGTIKYVSKKLKEANWRMDPTNSSNTFIINPPPTNDIPIKSTLIRRVQSFFRFIIGRSELVLIDY